MSPIFRPFFFNSTTPTTAPVTLLHTTPIVLKSNQELGKSLISKIALGALGACAIGLSAYCSYKYLNSFSVLPPMNPADTLEVIKPLQIGPKSSTGQEIRISTDGALVQKTNSEILELRVKGMNATEQISFIPCLETNLSTNHVLFFDDVLNSQQVEMLSMPLSNAYTKSFSEIVNQYHEKADKSEFSIHAAQVHFNTSPRSRFSEKSKTALQTDFIQAKPNTDSSKKEIYLNDSLDTPTGREYAFSESKPGFQPDFFEDFGKAYSQLEMVRNNPVDRDESVNSFVGDTSWANQETCSAADNISSKVCAAVVGLFGIAYAAVKLQAMSKKQAFEYFVEKTNSSVPVDPEASLEVKGNLNNENLVDPPSTDTEERESKYQAEQPKEEDKPVVIVNEESLNPLMDGSINYSLEVLDQDLNTNNSPQQQLMYEKPASSPVKDITNSPTHLSSYLPNTLIYQAKQDDINELNKQFERFNKEDPSKLLRASPVKLEDKSEVIFPLGFYETDEKINLRNENLEYIPNDSESFEDKENIQQTSPRSPVKIPKLNVNQYSPLSMPKTVIGSQDTSSPFTSGMKSDKAKKIDPQYSPFSMPSKSVITSHDLASPFTSGMKSDKAKKNDPHYSPLSMPKPEPKPVNVSDNQLSPISSFAANRAEIVNSKNETTVNNNESEVDGWRISPNSNNKTFRATRNMNPNSPAIKTLNFNS
ncbi:MAG TPA: hypothetical protein VGP47_07530 [Parachlamydiaceae bacterium]|nr:hypothetical protein [Parachlamydiaceae bacterium]